MDIEQSLLRLEIVAGGAKVGLILQILDTKGDTAAAPQSKETHSKTKQPGSFAGSVFDSGSRLHIASGT